MRNKEREKKLKFYKLMAAFTVRMEVKL